MPRILHLAILLGLLLPLPASTPVAELNQALTAARDASSPARQRLALRRIIRDAEQLVETQKNSPTRFPLLEFLFRARQQLIALDDDPDHRKALLETCRELVQAPNEMAELRLEADLLLSQSEVARQASNAKDRGKALRPFVARYLDTPSAAKVIRMTMIMALELGDNALVSDLQTMIAERFPGDPEMISFQRDKLNGYVVPAPFIGTFETSEGELRRFPIDGLGRTTILFFWSREGKGAAILKGLATAAVAMKAELAGRIDFASVNVDDLPDAGASIVRSHGVDWPVLRLPGGRQNPIYQIYAGQDPRLLTVTPTGYTGLMQAGFSLQRQNVDGETNFSRMLGASLALTWAHPDYTARIASLMAGDFLVTDPAGGIDPARTPELKALAQDNTTPLPRGSDAVPAETLQAIQACFVAPPQRYHLSHPETIAHYSKAADLARAAIAAHPHAPDLWIVRNRLLVALLGLWKTEAKTAHLTAAITEAQTALTAGYPPGCDLIARFCIARGDLRAPNADPKAILATFLRPSGDENAPGPAYAAAALLALDAADRKSFDDHRATILQHHTESPMMWTFTTFLLDRHHQYWLFQEPSSGGWAHGSHYLRHMQHGDREPAHRLLRAELQTLDGKPFRIPEDLDSDWTAIVFAQPGPWRKKSEDTLPPDPNGFLDFFSRHHRTRPPGEVKCLIAMLDGDAASIRAGFGKTEPPCPVLIVPNSTAHPLVQRLGLLLEKNQQNVVLIDRLGRIALMVPGRDSKASNPALTLANVIAREDEKSIATLLANGDIESARKRILPIAPPYDPNAVDHRGRKLQKPEYNLAHLRARARVFLALKQYDIALADAEEILTRQRDINAVLSIHTPELAEAKALKEEILRLMPAKP
jgi:hypothetical protein